jgi:hypothetical protein
MNSSTYCSTLHILYCKVEYIRDILNSVAELHHVDATQGRTNDAKRKETSLAGNFSKAT